MIGLRLSGIKATKTEMLWEMSKGEINDITYTKFVNELSWDDIQAYLAILFKVCEGRKGMLSQSQTNMIFDYDDNGKSTHTGETFDSDITTLTTQWVGELVRSGVMKCVSLSTCNCFVFHSEKDGRPMMITMGDFVNNKAHALYGVFSVYRAVANTLFSVNEVGSESVKYTPMLQRLRDVLPTVNASYFGLLWKPHDGVDMHQVLTYLVGLERNEISDANREAISELLRSINGGLIGSASAFGSSLTIDESFFFNTVSYLLNKETMDTMEQFWELCKIVNVYADFLPRHLRIFSTVATVAVLTNNINLLVQYLRINTQYDDFKEMLNEYLDYFSLSLASRDSCLMFAFRNVITRVLKSKLVFLTEDKFPVTSSPTKNDLDLVHRIYRGVVDISIECERALANGGKLGKLSDADREVYLLQLIDAFLRVKHKLMEKDGAYESAYELLTKVQKGGE